MPSWEGIDLAPELEGLPDAALRALFKPGADEVQEFGDRALTLLAKMILDLGDLPGGASGASGAAMREGLRLLRADVDQIWEGMRPTEAHAAPWGGVDAHFTITLAFAGRLGIGVDTGEFVPVAHHTATDEGLHLHFDARLDERAARTAVVSACLARAGRTVDPFSGLTERGADTVDAYLDGLAFNLNAAVKPVLH